MADEQNGQVAPLREVSDFVEQPGLRDQVQTGERLVQKQEGGLSGNRSREGGSLLLASGKRSCGVGSC